LAGSGKKKEKGQPQKSETKESKKKKTTPSCVESNRGMWRGNFSVGRGERGEE